MKSRLLVLWSLVGLFVLGTGIGLTWFYGQVQREELARNQRDATLDDKHRARRNANGNMRVVPTLVTGLVSANWQNRSKSCGGYSLGVVSVDSHQSKPSVFVGHLLPEQFARKTMPDFDIFATYFPLTAR